MKKNIIRGSLFAIVTLLVPFVLTCLINNNQSELDMKELNSVQIYDSSDPNRPLDFDTYITGIVLASIPANYNIETLKAQAVIARTYALKNIITLKHNTIKVPNIDTLDPTSTGFTTAEIGLPYLSSVSYLRNHPSKEYQAYLSNINSAVKSTRGEVITYKKNLITPLFFAASAGKTRDSKEIWSIAIPYLTSVDSNQDIESADYMKISLYPIDSVLQLLDHAYSNKKLGAADYDYQVYEHLPVDYYNIFDSIEIVQRDCAGYVLTISIGGVLISGDSFANVLSLNSSCFYIEEYEESMRIICNGSGHGIGFSQYGANILATKEDYSYKELLSHYYTDIKIETIQ